MSVFLKHDGLYKSFCPYIISISIEKAYYRYSKALPQI